MLTFLDFWHHIIILQTQQMKTCGWLVGCFGFNGPLRQYFSLYRAVSQREGERGEKGQTREKMSKQPPPAPTASATGPCPTLIQISRTPQHWKFTQHLRTTRPPPKTCEVILGRIITLWQYIKAIIRMWIINWIWCITFAMTSITNGCNRYSIMWSSFFALFTENIFNRKHNFIVDAS